MTRLNGNGYAVVIEPAEDGGYGVYVPDLPGCVSFGDSIEEAKRMIGEAIHGHIALLREKGEPIPQPRTTTAVIAA